MISRPVFGGARLSDDLAGLETVRNGDEQRSRLREIGGPHHSRRVASYGPDVSSCKVGDDVVLLVDDEERHAELLQCLADPPSDTAVPTRTAWPG